MIFPFSSNASNITGIFSITNRNLSSLCLIAISAFLCAFSISLPRRARAISNASSARRVFSSSSTTIPDGNDTASSPNNLSACLTWMIAVSLPKYTSFKKQSPHFFSLSTILTVSSLSSASLMQGGWFLAITSLLKRDMSFSNPEPLTVINFPSSFIIPNHTALYPLASTRMSHTFCRKWSLLVFCAIVWLIVLMALRTLFKWWICFWADLRSIA